MEIRTLVTFRTTKFNTSENKPYYINPGCFGDDVAEWIAEQLKASGARVDSNPRQEDFGWYLGFQYGLYSYDFVIGHNPDGYWIGWLERKRGLLGSAFGMRKKGIQLDAANAIHSILVSSSDISHIRWHNQDDFDALKEELGTETPSTNDP